MIEIKNLKKAANRIKKAIKKNERIILYGDSDLDGAASVIILADSIKNLGGNVTFVYFPDREKEGYGLNKTALDLLKKFTPALLILMDCGISNFKEIKLAKKMGFETIIIDHHETLEKLPEAEIIVDPKQKNDKYPFKGLAATGIVYKLAKILLTFNPKGLTDSLEKNFLELTVLATLADMMPEVEENKTMIEEGLPLLKNTFRPGLKAFFERDEIQSISSLRAMIQKIVSVLNIIEHKEHLSATYLILTSNSLDEAKVLIDELFEKQEQKQRETSEITEEVEGYLSQKIKEIIIFEGNYYWPLSLLGAVASRICRKHQKPVFLYKKKEKESRGAVRTPANINAVEMMKKCSKNLIAYGGHPLAAGFTVKNENLEKFKECLIKNIESLSN